MSSYCCGSCVCAHTGVVVDQVCALRLPACAREPLLLCAPPLSWPVLVAAAAVVAVLALRLPSRRPVQRWQPRRPLSGRRLTSTRTLPRIRRASRDRLGALLLRLSVMRVVNAYAVWTAFRSILGCLATWTPSWPGAELTPPRAKQQGALTHSVAFRPAPCSVWSSLTPCRHHCFGCGRHRRSAPLSSPADPAALPWRGDARWLADLLFCPASAQVGADCAFARVIV